MDLNGNPLPSIRDPFNLSHSFLNMESQSSQFQNSQNPHYRSQVPRNLSTQINLTMVFIHTSIFIHTQLVRMWIMLLEFLQGRFAIICCPARIWHLELIGKVMHACIIMHNMLLKDEHFRYRIYFDTSHTIEQRTFIQPLPRYEMR